MPWSSCQRKNSLGIHSNSSSMGNARCHYRSMYEVAEKNKSWSSSWLLCGKYTSQCDVSLYGSTHSSHWMCKVLALAVCNGSWQSYFCWCWNHDCLWFDLCGRFGFIMAAPGLTRKILLSLLVLVIAISIRRDDSADWVEQQYQLRQVSIPRMTRSQSKSLSPILLSLA